MSEFATDDRMDVPQGLKSVLENSISKLRAGSAGLNFGSWMLEWGGGRGRIRSSSFGS